MNVQVFPVRIQLHATIVLDHIDVNARQVTMVLSAIEVIDVCCLKSCKYQTQLVTRISYISLIL